MARKRTRFEGVYQRESTTRRHNGRPDIYYEITFKHGGRKVWEKVGWASEGYTATFAQKKRGERIMEMRDGVSPPQRPGKGRSLTLGEAWKLYDENWLAVSTRSRGADVSRYSKHLSGMAGRELSAICPFDVERLKAGLLSSGMSEQSVRHVLNLLSRLYNKLAEWRLWNGSNPVSAVKRPSKDSKRWRYLTPDEARALLDALAARSRLTHDMALLSLHTGMRFGEVAALTWEDIDHAARTIRVMDTKNGESRAAYMTQEVTEMLTSRRGLPGPLVFPGRPRRREGSQPMDGVSRTFERTVDAIGLNEGVTDTRGRVVFHTFRHTFASWMVMQGVPISEIGELLGHSDLEMTRRYAHLAPERKRMAIGSMEKVFRSARHRCEPQGLQSTPLRRIGDI
jgi:integrase